MRFRMAYSDSLAADARSTSATTSKVMVGRERMTVVVVVGGGAEAAAGAGGPLEIGAATDAGAAGQHGAGGMRGSWRLASRNGRSGGSGSPAGRPDGDQDEDGVAVRRSS
jgi:hypothetical protein